MAQPRFIVYSSADVTKVPMLDEANYCCWRRLFWRGVGCKFGYTLPGRYVRKQTGRNKIKSYRL
jgi:hypothetical protein